MKTSADKSTNSIIPSSLSKKDLFIYTRGTIPLYRCYMALKAIHEQASQLLGLQCDMIAYSHEYGKLYWGWSDAEIRALGEKIWEKTKTTEGMKQHFSYLRRIAQEAIAAADAILLLDLKEYTSDELISKHKQYYQQVREAHAVMNLDVDAVDIVPVEYLRKEFKTFLRTLDTKAFEEIYGKLTIPKYLSYVGEEQKLLLKLLIELKKNNIKVIDITKTNYYRKLESIKNKYWWTNLGWENMDCKTMGTYIDALKEYESILPNPEQKLVELEQYETKIEKQRKELYQKYSISNYLQQRITFFDEYTEIHDLRKEMQMRTAYSFDQFLKEFAQRLKQKITFLNFYTHEELYHLLTGTKTFDKNEAEQRYNAEFLFTYKHAMHLWYGKEAEALIKKHFKDGSENNENLKIIKGVCSSPGKARGIVKVCAGSAEAMKKITKGDVLVTGMTLPDYVPAMKKAAAIVTDEGGITCHAAIVSRELGIPCVTSTKIASEVLKDGMKVEVDADNGTVKIIT